MMVAKKKTETLKKKKAAPAKKTAVKKTASARKQAAKTVKGSKTAAAKKSIAPKKSSSKKTLPGKPAVRKVKKVKVHAEKKTDRLGELKRALIGKREHIVKEAKEEISKYISGENRQLVDTALDEGDWAVVDISEDINLRRLDAHRKSLHDIDEALRKIREGTYGICEDCGEEISEKRLHVMPAASLCISCQENKEQLEALEKAETP